MDAATKLMKLGSKALNVTPSVHNPTLITWVDKFIPCQTRDLKDKKKHKTQIEPRSCIEIPLILVALVHGHPTAPTVRVTP
jgi:hypothetical protein